MQNREEKLSLLLDMIAFSVVDGKLDAREYEFLLLIARELQIDKIHFDELFHQEQKSGAIKSEAQRIHQFYRLALLMHIDGELHPNEEKSIFEIGIKMGLNPMAMRRILNIMKASDNKILNPNLIFDIFREQQN